MKYFMLVKLFISIVVTTKFKFYELCPQNQFNFSYFKGPSPSFKAHNYYSLESFDSIEDDSRILRTEIHPKLTIEDKRIKEQIPKDQEVA